MSRWLLKAYHGRLDGKEALDWFNNEFLNTELNGFTPKILIEMFENSSSDNEKMSIARELAKIVQYVAKNDATLKFEEIPYQLGKINKELSDLLLDKSNRDILNPLKKLTLQEKIEREQEQKAFEDNMKKLVKHITDKINQEPEENWDEDIDTNKNNKSISNKYNIDLFEAEPANKSLD